jgi:hypothetical protein
MKTKLASITSFVVTVGLAAACSSASVPAGVDTNNPRGLFVEADGASCVDIELSSYSQTCSTASDCTLIAVGTICSGADACAECTTTPINKSGEAQYQAAVSLVTVTGICACPAEIVPSCVHGTCTICAGSSDPACSDGGSGDAGTCVDIDAESFDQSCTTASECTTITAGEICSDTCLCGGTTINKNGEARYAKEIAGLGHGECSCPNQPIPACTHGKCTLP